MYIIFTKEDKTVNTIKSANKNCAKKIAENENIIFCAICTEDNGKLIILERIK